MENIFSSTKTKKYNIFYFPYKSSQNQNSDLIRAMIAQNITEDCSHELARATHHLTRYLTRLVSKER